MTQADHIVKCSNGRVNAVFRRSIRNLPQFVRMVLREFEISDMDYEINKTQINILMSVDENGDLSMSEISRITGLEKSSFTRSVDFLERKDFLERVFPDHDRRKVMLALTPKGVKAVTHIRKELDEYMRSLLSEFSEKEKSDFFGSLDVLSGYIDRILRQQKALRK